MEEKHETKKKRTKPFNSFSVLAKATTRAQRAIEQALPKTPNRRKAVQRELFRQSAIQNDAGDKPIERPKLVHTLSDDLKQQVENFYRHDDISRQAPCRKDVVSMKGNGSCTKYQTRHLTSSFNKVFALFQEGNSVSNHPIFLELHTLISQNFFIFAPFLGIIQIWELWKFSTNNC